MGLPPDGNHRVVQAGRVYVASYGPHHSARNPEEEHAGNGAIQLALAVHTRSPKSLTSLLLYFFVFSWRTLRIMLFMVIERFKDGDAAPIGKRFKFRGRMLPEGVTYHASWVDSTGTRCFQVMETLRLELLNT